MMMLRVNASRLRGHGLEALVLDGVVGEQRQDRVPVVTLGHLLLDLGGSGGRDHQPRSAG